MQHCPNKREKPWSVWIITHLLFSCRSFIIHHSRTCGATLHLCKSLFLASRPSSSSSSSPTLLPSSSTLSRKIIPHLLPRPQHRNIIISRTPTSTTFFLPPPAPAPAPAQPPPPRLLGTSQTPSIHRRRKPRSFFPSSSSSSETSNRPCGSFTLSKTLAGVDFLL